MSMFSDARWDTWKFSSGKRYQDLTSSRLSLPSSMLKGRGDSPNRGSLGIISHCSELQPSRLPRPQSVNKHIALTYTPLSWVQREARPISLRQLTYFGRTLTEERLLSSANYVRTELPTRYYASDCR
jgi:hypothetical protein